MYCDLWSQYINVRKLFKGGNYSRAETIWGNTVVDIDNTHQNYIQVIYRVSSKDFSIERVFIYVKSHRKSPEKKTLSIEKSLVPSDSQGIPVIIVEEKNYSVYFQQNLNFLIAILQGENENISLQFHCTAALSFSLKSWNTSAILFRLYSKDTIFGFKKFSFYLLQRYIPRFLSKKLSSSSCC